MKNQLVELKTRLDSTEKLNSEDRAEHRADRSRRLLTILLLCFVPMISLGCKSAQPGSWGGLFRPVQVIVTNQAPAQIVTQQAEVRDVAGVTVTNLVTLTNIETRTSFVTNTVWEVAPSVKGSIDTVNSFAPLAGPYAPAIAFGTSALSVLLGAVVRRKNAQNESLNGQLTAVIHGVEDAAKVLPEGNKLKSTIADVANKLDVAEELRATVKEVTA